MLRLNFLDKTLGIEIEKSAFKLLDPSTPLLIVLDDCSSSYFWVEKTPEYDESYVKNHPEYIIEDDLLDEISSLEMAVDITDNGAWIYCADLAEISDIVEMLELQEHTNYKITCIYALAVGSSPTVEPTPSISCMSAAIEPVSQGSMDSAGFFDHPGVHNFRVISEIDLKPKYIKEKHLKKRLSEKISALLRYGILLSLIACVVTVVGASFISRKISHKQNELSTRSWNKSSDPELILGRFKAVSDENLLENKRFNNLFLAFCAEMEQIEDKPLIESITYDKSRLLSARLKGASKPGFEKIKNINSSRITVRSGPITTINDETFVDVNIQSK